MKKTKKISMRVSEELKKEMIEVSSYYNLSLSKFIELMFRTSQDKDSKTNKHIEKLTSDL
ncbi:hypothetical protein [Methylophilus methylotrophus]|uniref:hypothetical protein n=1 Tax=Methylophilus methylotrophus TaxID=17 RepID=UPI0003699442|nr:hypothetical protein [Methylophilus methylotrophus]